MNELTGFNTMDEKNNLPNFVWVAKYKDGSIIGQYNDQFIELSTDNLPDRDEIDVFTIFDIKTGKKILSIHFDEGQRLIYRRRVVLKTGFSTPKVYYLVGWQQTVNGQNIQSIAYIHEESGQIEIAGKFRDDHPIFKPVQSREWEIIV